MQKSNLPLDINQNIQYNIKAIGVWRSLVSRLVRVQEASGSNPDTPTKIPVTTYMVTEIFFVSGFEEDGRHEVTAKNSKAFFTTIGFIMLQT